MKILLLSQDLHTLGGVQRVVTTMIDGLIEYKEYDIDIIMPDEKKDFNYFEINSKTKIVDFDILSTCKLNIISKIFKKINNKTGIFNFNIFNLITKKIVLNEKKITNLVEYINNENYDVVIATGDYFTLILGMIANKIKPKTIGWQHSSFDAYFNTKGKNSYGFKQLAKKNYSNLDWVFVLTKKDKEDFKKYFDIDSSVLYNPLPSVTHSITKLNSGQLLFVGRLCEPQKGLNHLVNIVKKIKKIRPDIKCLVIGDGPDKEKLESLICNNDLQNNLILMGRSNDVYKYYVQADILLQTSNWEGFGMNIIEAMSCGLPVVSFHNNGPDEIIHDGYDGYLINKYDIIDFANKILNLLDNKEKISEFSKNALERSNEFELQKIIEDFDNKIVEITR